jgi:hypothetical protein
MAAASAELNFCGKRVIKQPQPQDLVNALGELAKLDDGYIILARAPQEYVQTASGIVEYRERGQHFRTVADPVAPTVIQELFLAYLRGDADWQQGTEWKDVTEELTPTRRGSLAWVLAVAVLLLLAAAALFRFLK